MDTDISTAERWLTTHHERLDDEITVEFDVFVRSLSPPPGVRQRQEQLFNRLQTLQSEGHIDSYRVNLWGGGVCLCDICSETSVAESMLDNIEEFEEWASTYEDVSLPFERQSVDSTMVGRTSEDLVVPSMCLSVRGGTDIYGVFPCTVAGESISVTDYIESIDAVDQSGPEQVDERDAVVQF